MSKNTNLHEAKNNRKDEFYTTKITVESELGHYWDHFKGKVIYCNCDDPYESEFFKYFAIRFNLLGLKGLYASCYEGSQMSQHQLQLFEDEDYKGIPYKIELYQKDIDELLEEYDGTLSQETIKSYIKKHKKAKRLKGNGSFDSPECLKLLEKADIICSNPPFSLFRSYLKTLEDYKKDFIIYGNNNAITYKEVFPLIKENKMWLGYTANKTCVFKMPPSYDKYDEKLTAKYNDGFKYGKVPAISVFTNLDIPKRHEDLILWKKYSPEEYPHYDNYDAINVDKVAEIPCDYCESWGLYPEEFETLDKTLWEEVRREPKDETELIYVIPAKNTELRQTLHNHSEGYKEKIETELANAIYCNGEIGAPITVVDKLNNEQFKIVGADFDLAQPVELDNGKTDTGRFYVQKGLDNHTAIGNNPAKEPRSQGANVFTAELSFARYCNGIFGVPITFLDKWSPEQFKLFGATESEGTGFSNGLWYSNSKVAQPLIRNNRKYKRLFIQKIL